MYSFAFVVSIAVLIFSLNADVVSSQGNTYNSTIQFYTGSTVADYVTYNLTTAENVADHPHFNSSRRSMIFFHGWTQSPQTLASRILLNAYLANGTFNILALDWSKAASSIFLDTAVQRVEPLGIAVALFIDRWNSQKGVPFSKMHLVGHSLGAHLAGSAGKYTQGWSGQTKYIDRITGLDPAYVAADFLQWRYARFVDIIHTDATGTGTNQNTGHVDFWPNNGVAVQPGCAPAAIDQRAINASVVIIYKRVLIMHTALSKIHTKFLNIIDIHPASHSTEIIGMSGMSTIPVERDESHVRALLLYAESVERANRVGNFVSTNNANANIKIEMGLNCPTNAQGLYTLYTNGASWYSQS